MILPVKKIRIAVNIFFFVLFLFHLICMLWIKSWVNHSKNIRMFDLLIQLLKHTTIQQIDDDSFKTKRIETMSTIKRTCN